MILQTERLSLRELTLEDAAFLLRLFNEPSFIENISDKGLRTLEDARSYLLNGPLKSYRERGFGHWLVARKPEAIPIGICGLIQREGLQDVDLGYALLPEFWSVGYAAEVCVAVRTYAQTTLGLTRLVAVVNEGNARSIRLLTRLAFRYERRVRLVDGEQELLLYGWQATPATSDCGKLA